jgi:CheY-like chemotaxis protein
MYLRGDSSRIGQILLNLISNAIKFTSSGSIFVQAQLVDHVQGKPNSGPLKIKFSITDTGIGISSIAVSQLFQPFMQADRSTTRKYGGTGLGLSISKKLVQLMNGEIGVESTEGKGSNFWFTLPLMPGEAPADMQLQPRADLNNYRILVVDSDPIARNVLHEYIISWGASNGRAQNAKDCLEILHREAINSRPYDLVFLGLGAESLETAEKISSDPLLKKTKLILIKDYRQAISDSEMLKGGFHCSIAKPFKQSQIFDCIVSARSNNSESSTGVAQFSNSISTETFEISESKGRILLVEDNLVNQMVAKALLEKYNYSVLVAANGKDALQHLAIADFDLILMDCQMPVMDGFEATKAIREMSHAVKSKIPIIALTANAMKTDEDMCLQVGMNDYISKPIRKEILERKLQQWIVKTKT